MLFDTHCHVQFNSFQEDAEEVLKRCQEKDMILNVVGSQIDTSRAAVAFAEAHENVYATIGVHPVHTTTTDVDEEETSFTSREEIFDYDEYKKLAQSKKVIGIGECGLELFHLPPNANIEEILKKQTTAFDGHYKLAVEMDLPLVLHVRDAHKEMIELLKSYNEQIRGVVHCYTGNWEFAQEYLKLGLHLGFTGVVTFPPKKLNPEIQLGLLEVIEKMPMDRILAETDSPYLAPQAHRGKRCEPWMVEEVIKKIAEVRNMSAHDVNNEVFKNSRELFNV